MVPSARTAEDPLGRMAAEPCRRAGSVVRTLLTKYNTGKREWKPSDSIKVEDGAAMGAAVGLVAENVQASGKASDKHDARVVSIAPSRASDRRDARSVPTGGAVGDGGLGVRSSSMGEVRPDGRRDAW